MDRINDDLLGPIIRIAAQANARADGDYYDDEGFLCCGKCHTRKECEIPLPGGPDDINPEKSRFPIMCKCRKEAFEAEENRAKKQKDMEVVDRLRRESLMSPRFAEATFENFRKDEENEYNFRVCLRYAEHFDKMLLENQGLIFYGEVGTGKSFAAACIANYLLSRGISVVMTSFVKLLSTMQTYGNDNERLISDLNRAKLLIIDDFGAERDSAFAQEHVYNIIDSRYRAKRPLIITTNLDTKELWGQTGVRYSRIYDRLSEMLPVEFTGGSWRKGGAARKLTRMKNFLEGNDG